MKKIVFLLTLNSFVLTSMASCLGVRQSGDMVFTANEQPTEQPADTNLSMGEPVAQTTQANGQYTYTVNHLPYFDGVEVSSGIVLRYQPNGQPSVKVSLDKKNDRLVQVYVDEGELKVRLKRSFSRSPRVVVTITGHALNEFEASSGASIQFLAPLSVNGKLSLNASSGSSIRANGLKAHEIDVDASSGGQVVISGIQATMVEAEASSGGNLSLNGRTDQAKFDASSGGTLKAEQLKVQHAEVEASSGGTIVCNAATLTFGDDNSRTGTVRNVAK